MNRSIANEDFHNNSYQVDHELADHTGSFRQRYNKADQSIADHNLDDSKSFHIDMGKFVIQDNYMYATDGSKVDLDSSINSR